MSIDVSRMSIEELKSLRARIDGIIDGPGDKLDGLDSAIQRMKALRSEVAATGKAAVSRAITAFLDKHPEVDSVRWTQYTPYFADGDTPEFSVNDIDVKLTDATGDEGDREDGYQDTWSIGYYAEKAGNEKPAYLASLSKDVKALNGLLTDAEDAMRATFGDHVEVTVGRDGQAIVEEYDHE